MTLLDFSAALRQQIRVWYPQVPVESLDTGLLSQASVAYWLSTGKAVDDILVQTMGRPLPVHES